MSKGLAQAWGVGGKAPSTMSADEVARGLSAYRLGEELPWAWQLVAGFYSNCSGAFFICKGIISSSATALEFMIFNPLNGAH